MKGLLRGFLVSLSSLWITSWLLPGLQFSGDLQILMIGALVFMVINFTVVPLLKILFLPLNLLTFGFFTWVINVISLFVLTRVITQFQLVPYDFPGMSLAGVMIPGLTLNTLQVAIVASLLIGLIMNLLKWLIR